MLFCREFLIVFITDIKHLVDTYLLTYALSLRKTYNTRTMLVVWNQLNKTNSQVLLQQLLYQMSKKNVLSSAAYTSLNFENSLSKKIIVKVVLVILHYLHMQKFMITRV